MTSIKTSHRYPLSSSQREIWFDQILHPNVPLYNIGGYQRIEGYVDPLILEKALNQLIQDNDALRIILHEEEQLATQEFLENILFKLDFHDFSDKDTPHEGAIAWMEQEFTRPFQLYGRLLFRFALCKISHDRYYLFGTYHHLIVDGWANSLNVQRVAKIYNALLSGEANDEQQCYSYLDFIKNDQAYLTSKKVLQHEHHWLEKYHDIPNLLIPRQYKAMFGDQTIPSQRATLSLKRTFYNQLITFAKENGASTLHVILGVLYCYFIRTSGEKDFVIGLPTLNRSTAAFKQTVGLFVGVSPARFHFGTDLNFVELLHAISMELRNDYRCQRFPISEINKQIQLSKTGRKQLFDITLSYEKHDYSVNFSGNLCKAISFTNGFEQNALTVFIREFHEDQDVRVDFDYNLGAFKASDIEYIKARFKFLLEKVLYQSHLPIKELQIMPDEELNQVIRGFNNTAMNYPREKTIIDLFEEQVERMPDNVAVAFENQQLTYQALNHQANQLAHYLQTLKIGPEILVGICIERSLEMVIGLLGVLKAGGAYLPLDPTYPKERLVFMLEDTQVSILLTQKKLVEKLPSLEKVQFVLLDTDWQAISQSSLKNPISKIQSENLAYAIYTSGSTGKPKGVLITHQGLTSLIETEIHAFDVYNDSRILQFVSLGFDVAISDIAMALCSGATLCLYNQDSHLLGSDLIKFLCNQTITHLEIPVSVLTSLPLEEISTLQTIIVGGETCSANLVEQWATGRRFFNAYGPTEITVCASIAECFDGKQKPSIGHPITNTQIYILDCNLQPVPINVSGELYIGGVGLARGYFNRPELTVERFIPNPFSEEPGSRLYKTGDLACYLPDGNIDYLGRLDNQVKIRGFRIELEEIETVLSQHHNMREAAVIAREEQPGEKRLIAYVVSRLTMERIPYQSDCLVKIDHQTLKVSTEEISKGGTLLTGVSSAFKRGLPVRLHLLLPGESEQRWLTGKVAWHREHQAGIQLKLSATEQSSVNQSLAFLYKNKGFFKALQRTIAGSLRSYLKDKLPDYMIPAAFVLLEALPLTPNGKVDRRALPVPEFQLSSEETVIVPRTPTEEILVTLWTDLLKVRPIGIHDNFFELGGHSLLAIQVISRIRDALSVELPLHFLFESPTIADLAPHIETFRGHYQSPPIEHISRKTELPLSFAQEGLWFLTQLEGRSATYNVPAALCLGGPLDPIALEKSFMMIVQRHESLRTLFPAVNGVPVIQLSVIRYQLPTVNLQNLPLQTQSIEVQKLIQQEAQRSFDLSKGPLLRTILLQLAVEEQILLVTMHHIISDGWSSGVFLREWLTLYEAFSKGEASPLPALPIQYADFADWQRRWLTGEILETQLNYWQQQLANAPDRLELPTDYPRPLIQRFRGSTESIQLNQDLSQKIKFLSQQMGATLFMTLLAAFAILLSRYSRQEDLIIGTPVANRDRSETESLIGFFVNTLALRVKLSKNLNFKEFLTKQVRKVCLDAYAHQSLPFEKLIERLHPERNLSHIPFIQAAFALQNVELPAIEIPGLTISPITANTKTAKTDLTLFIQEEFECLNGTVEYNTDLFKSATILQILADFQKLLETIVSEPEQRLSKLFLSITPIQPKLAKTSPAKKEGFAAIKEQSNLTGYQFLTWLGHHLDPKTPLYNMVTTFTISTPVELEHFQSAFQTLVNSSDALRTVIQEIKSIPQQQVIAYFPYVVESMDFSQLSLEARQAWIQKRSQIPFDLEKCLFDCVLIKVSETVFTWYLNQHHLISDGSSTAVIFNYMTGFYEDSLKNQLPQQVPLVLFQDYIDYERAYRTSSRYLKDQAYWQEKFAENLAPLQFYGKTPIKRTTKNQRVSYELSVDRTQKLNALIEQGHFSTKPRNTSVFALFLAILSIYLWRVSHQKTVSIGVVMHNRRSKRFKGTIGAFWQVVPLHISIESDATGLSFVEKIEKLSFEALRHGQYVINNPVQQPVYDVIFNYHTESFGVFQGTQVDFEWVHGGHFNESLALQVRDFEASGNLAVDFDFNEQVFEEAQRHLAIEHFMQVLDSFLENSHQTIGHISLLSAEEKRRILVDFNPTPTRFPQQTLCQQFEEQVQKTPGKVAVVFEQQSLTYAQLNSKANQLAHHLRTMNVKPEVRVGVYVERSLEMSIGILGILKAGGAYLPLDPTYPTARLAFMLEDAQVPVLLTQEKLLSKLPTQWSVFDKGQEVGKAVKPLDNRFVICLDTDWPVISQASDENLTHEIQPQNVAYVIYTSGSTGKPKGVLVTHANVTRLFAATHEWFHFNEQDIWTFFHSYAFDFSVWELWGALLYGGCLVIVPYWISRSSEAFYDLIRQQRVTVLNQTPSAFHQLVQFDQNKTADDLNLRWVIFGGEALECQRLKPWFERHGDQCPQLVNMYGITETTVHVTYQPLTIADLSNGGSQIGVAISDLQTYILDTDLQPVAIGIPGELYISGAGLAQGYLNHPALTAEKFIPNPFWKMENNQENTQRLYKTGDLARYLPEGNIEYLGRIDNQIKIRGFRIELGEIESLLIQHDDVQEAIVIAKEISSNDLRLIAYVVSNLTLERIPYQSTCWVETEQVTLKLHTEEISSHGVSLAGISTHLKPGQLIRLHLKLPGESQQRWFKGKVAWEQQQQTGLHLELSPFEQSFFEQRLKHFIEKQGFYKTLQRTLAGSLRTYMKELVPDYMVPMAFIVLESLPLTANGKIDYHALPDIASYRELEENFVTPQTPTEEILAAIWAELLGLEAICRNDNFFELGGHSLLATQVISRIRDAFSVELPLRQLFESPTVGGLGKQIEASRCDYQVPPIQAVSRAGNLQLSFAQQRLWFIDQLEGKSATYNIPAAFHLKGPLNITALAQSLKEIVQRHETLRTTFSVENGVPIQVIQKLSVSNYQLSIINLQELPNDRQASEVLWLANQEAQHALDLSKGPLFRTGLLQLNPEEHILLVTMHHIISDGWSVGIFVREIGRLYEAFSKEMPCSLPILPLQYADFAHWQRQWLTGDFLEAQLNYWQQQLSEIPTLLKLPTDKPRPAIQRFQGRTQHFELTAELTQQLKKLSQRSGTTLFMTLLAAFATLLGRYSGQKHIAIGSPIANRTQSQIESMIGFFVNMLVMHTNLTGNPSFQELLTQVRQVCLDAYAHQDIPFEYLVEELQPERSLSHSPLFQVAFVLQNAPMENLELSGLTLTALEQKTVTARFDLTLSMMEVNQCLSGNVEYNTDIFDNATITRMFKHFQLLLAGITENPQQRLNELPLLAQQERQQIEAWNDTQIIYPTDKCLHQLIEAQIAKTPTAIAVVFEEQALSYNALNKKANQLAHHLQTLGVKPEVLVGICIERSLEMVIGLLGILKAGGAYVPLDPDYPLVRLRFMLDDAKLPVLLTQKKLLSKIFPPPSEEKAQLSPLKGETQVICLDSDWTDIAQYSAENPLSEVRPENLAYMIYTSGSTGQPKGAMNTHLGINNRLLWMQEAYQLTANDKVLQKTPFSFDVSVWEFFWPLLTGACLVVAKPGGHQDSAYLVKTIIEQHITTLHFVPSMFQVFLQEQGIENCTSLRQLFCSGEALPYDLQTRFFDRLTTTKLHNLYGPTEAAVDVTFWACQKKEDDNRQIIPIGSPIANIQTYILDQDLHPVPIGISGELHIGGVGLARGYFNRPELTAEKFIPLPPDFQQAETNEKLDERVYKTGDLARYLPDGNIEYLGRIDHQVKMRGFRIELGEIEATLMQHPLVQEAVVTFQEKQLTPSEADKRLVAYIVFNFAAELKGSKNLAGTSDIEQVSQWEKLYDEIYSRSVADEPTFDIVGWNDSYTEQPIPPEVMQEWVNSTVERIMAYQPNRVFEIGCGTGLLLFRIAPHCSYYYGTDISSKVLHSVKQHLKNMTNTEKPVISVSQQPAHEFEGIEANAFDTVILNSVVQLFPNIHYLIDVLEGAVNAVAPGGIIFVGDVRSLPLLEAFHASVQLHQAPAALSKTQLQQRVQQHIAQDKELVIAPHFFVALKQHLPKINEVQIQLKRGNHHNELTQFRYDVIIHVGEEEKAENEKRKESQWLDWQKDELTLAKLQQWLINNQPEILVVKQIPNARVMAAVKITELLAKEQSQVTVGKLRETLQNTTQHEKDIDPEALWHLGDNLPYAISIVPDTSQKACYYAVFHRDGLEELRYSEFPLFDDMDLSNTWDTYASNPQQRKLATEWTPQLRTFLKQSLPDYMVPTAFVWLPVLPLTPNGKVDRNALPAPDSQRQSEKDFVAPRNAIEQQLVSIWEEILDVHPISIHDNFFEIGGHSLLAIRLMAQIQQHFEKNLPLATLFKGATVEQLALILSQDEAVSWLPLVALQPNGSKLPFFCVPGLGGNVTYFYDLARRLGTEQPFYGLQAVGLDGESTPHANIAEMASCYIKELQTVQPEGPYLLGGHSFGAYVAFEMAQQLQKQGHEIAHLAILDSPAPPINSLNIDLDEAHWIVEVACVIEHLLEKNLEVSYEALQPLSPSEQLKYLHDRLKKTQWLPPNASIKQLRGLVEVFKKNYRMSYAPQDFYPIHLTFFQASVENPERMRGEEFYKILKESSWENFAAGSMEIRTVPGDHLTMMMEPHVKGLAEQLSRCFEEAF